MKLLVFPFIIIAIFFLLFGFKVIKTFLVRQIEKSSVINVEKNNTSTQLNSQEAKLVKKYSNKGNDRDNDILSYGNFLTIKYLCIIFILSWYTYLITDKHIELATMLLVNIIIIYIYIYFIQYVLYIFYKIYINENVNKIEQEIKNSSLKNEIESKKIDFVIVNGENAASQGVGLTREICNDFFNCGVDVITTGNHVWDQKEIMEYIDNEKRLLRPKN
jgi:hypothetical protein